MTAINPAQEEIAIATDSLSAWLMLGVLFLVQMLVVGGIAYGFGLLAKPMAAEYGLSRADMNIGLMVLIVGMGLFSPLVGRALDRLPGQLVITGGALLFSLGCFIVAMAPSLPVMIAASFLLIASGGAALGPLPGSTLTARSFGMARGRALGIVSVSSSVGGLLVLPAMAWVVEHDGWRAAVAVMGLVVLLVGCGLGWLVRVPKSANGQGAGRNGVSEWTIGKAMATKDFWLIALAIGLMMCVDQALLASLISYGTDRGFSLQASTLIVSLISGFAIAGKLAIGSLSDRIDPRWLFLFVASLNAAFLVVLMLHPSYPMLLGASVIVGLGFGGTMPLWAALIANRYGIAAFGIIMGMMTPLQMPFTIGGLRYVGHVYDSVGSYIPAFGVFLVLVVMSGLFILPVQRRREIV
ncbi:MFS transporter [Sphingobium estronivorans]|uniref:MFS transporter n=1 Tax=Sphingobium estronivorans TaxID=1577690 RepID=UPI0012397039|nr:MFS transporter [Sphingobium estronivorans]